METAAGAEHSRERNSSCVYRQSCVYGKEVWLCLNNMIAQYQWKPSTPDTVQASWLTGYPHLMGRIIVL